MGDTTLQQAVGTVQTPKKGIDPTFMKGFVTGASAVSGVITAYFGVRMLFNTFFEFEVVGDEEPEENNEQEDDDDEDEDDLFNNDKKEE